MIGRFTTEDGGFYADPEGEMVLYTEYKAVVDKLQECQKYWDDEKRRYDAADKAFRLVCDERDSYSSRLDSAVRLLRASDGTPGYRAEVNEFLRGVVEKQSP